MWETNSHETETLTFSSLELLRMVMKLDWASIFGIVWGRGEEYRNILSIDASNIFSYFRKCVCMKKSALISVVRWFNWLHELGKTNLRCICKNILAVFDVKSANVGPKTTSARVETSLPRSIWLYNFRFVFSDLVDRIVPIARVGGFWGGFRPLETFFRSFDRNHAWCHFLSGKTIEDSIIYSNHCKMRASQFFQYHVQTFLFQCR